MIAWQYHYFGVNVPDVWETATGDLPSLMAQLAEILGQV